MPPRKKDAPSSSSTSSSNSSSSSTSSSSSSGSDSSSSDSENSSTSVGGKSGQHSSDSDKKPTPKKKSASATVTRSKSDASEPDKSKEKPSKSKPLITTTTSNKPGAPSNTSRVSSSDSEDESPKINSKRKPPAKPKSSATVTPVAKGQNKTTTKVSTNNSGVKKVNPPRKAAQKSASNTGSSSGLTSKELSSKATIGPKLDDQKKLKTKSIFSPDNTSDDSDDKATPPPPKLTAIKSSASKNTHNKTKTKPSPQTKSRASSVSSNSSDSSRSSRSSSDSSPDSSRTKTDNSSSAANRKANQLKKEKKFTAPPKLESDTDAPVVRKQTRSSSMRKSKHVISRIGSDSDSDTGTRTSASKSPAKKVGPKGPPCLRKPKSGLGEYNQHIEFEERSSCPFSGCDSIGHLSGKYEKHYILEACPRYHNMTPQQCKDALVERTKKEEERKKAQVLVKGQVHVPTADQRMYREKVKEMRSKHVTRDDTNSIGDSESKERQPDLSKWSNKYDLKLFQEAQAVASEAIEEELRQLANVNCTKYIEMGKFEMEVWYQSPYPEDFARLPKLYICEYCLRYMKSRTTLERHAAKCVWRHPPGEEVYRKEKISVWEVDGKRYKSYCQNLCLLAKFFLDHKTLYYDVEPFLFYVMTIGDSEGCHIVGYFSKEKNSFLNYNVSCILTLPPYQRQGYGRLLIEFSYLLTRVENKIGSPEKPLSDLGLISYRSYWKDVLLEYLCNLGGKQISVKDISQEMAINSYDIVSTLQALGMMKYWKGKHIILKKQDVIDEYVDRSKRRGVSYKEIDPECLKWSPYVPPDTPPEIRRRKRKRAQENHLV
ncbi:lysine acetyltransferase chameau isoform X2 [Rhodnius prolixus]|uniref:lysine acetyltransferase chameau isoform X2 n=1 Tax=Rhodnius prolixus TaxID=13249 RepID=UPI003D18BA17